MPYSVIIVILILLFAALSQIMVIKAVKFGIKITEKPEEAADEPFFHVPRPKKMPKMTEEQRRELQKYENVMRYDGTSNGQVKIEHHG